MLPLNNVSYLPWAFAALSLVIACDSADPDLDPSLGSSSDGSNPDPAADDPNAVVDPATCQADHLRALQRPVDPRDPDGETFTYYYQHIQGEGPTVLHLPGGPGGTSIGAEFPLFGEADLVLTDPRGVGCNAYGSPRKPEFYSTERFASDVLAIVRDLGLKDYVIHGHSYGTVLATVVASRAQAEGLPAPRVVVLEGIVGPAIQDDDAAYRELWGRVRDALPAAVQAQLLADEPPLGLTRLQWGEFITGILSQFAPQILFDQLITLDEGGDPTALRETVTAITEGPPSWENEQLMRLFRPVACREIAENSWFGFELVDGEVVPTINACDAIDLDQPYDPADWPIAAPIVYFEGDRDPATAPQGARAHFDAQSSTQRTFVSVRGVGHVPLQWFIADACGADVFNAVLDDRPLQPALDACGVEATVEVAMPK